jgi:hypothetical protein
MEVYCILLTHPQLQVRIISPRKSFAIRQNRIDGMDSFMSYATLNLIYAQSITSMQAEVRKALLLCPDNDAMHATLASFRRQWCGENPPSPSLAPVVASPARRHKRARQGVDDKEGPARNFTKRPKRSTAGRLKRHRHTLTTATTSTSPPSSQDGPFPGVPDLAGNISGRISSGRCPEFSIQSTASFGAFCGWLAADFR